MSLFDRNAEVLNHITAEGCDMTKVRLVDFEHLFPNSEVAETFARQIADLGFQTRIWLANREDYDDGEDEYRWNVTASKNMIPTCEDITSTEQQLDAIAHDQGGYADGWGFLSD